MKITPGDMVWFFLCSLIGAGLAVPFWAAFKAPSIPLPPITNDGDIANRQKHPRLETIYTPAVLAVDGTTLLKITGTNAESLVLWSRTQPVVTKTHEGWTVRFGK